MSEDMGASGKPDRAVVNGAGQAVSALRASVPSAALAVLLLAGCARAEADTPVPTEQDDQIREIAAGRNLDARFARVVLADGRATVREVKTWLAESRTAQAIEARRAETGTGSVHEGAVGSADAPESPSHD